MAKKGITVEQAGKIRKAKGIEETNLCKMRRKKGLSQRELGNVSGVAERAIRMYEQRERKIEVAKLNTLCDLALALGCRIEDILDNETLTKKYKAVK